MILPPHPTPSPKFGLVFTRTFYFLGLGPFDSQITLPQAEFSYYPKYFTHTLNLDKGLNEMHNPRIEEIIAVNCQSSRVQPEEKDCLRH